MDAYLELHNFVYSLALTCMSSFAIKIWLYPKCPFYHNLSFFVDGRYPPKSKLSN